MDHTPKRKSKLSMRNECKNDNCTTSAASSTSTSTPKQAKPLDFYDEYSPSFVPCTQEAYDELDVVWDWNSPQSKPIPKKHKQKRLQVRSPKPIVKKYSHTQPVVNEKLKNQLEKLKNQLETELKPSLNKNTIKNHSLKIENPNLKIENSNLKIENHLKPQNSLLRTENVKISNESLKISNENLPISIEEDLKDLEDLFNDDSMEEELILQSQKVESLINLKLKDDNCDNKSFSESKTEFRKFKSEDRLDGSFSKNNLRMKSNSSGDLYDSPKPRKSIASVKLETKFEANFDDSFDLAIQSFKDTDFKPNNSGNNLNRRQSKSNSSLTMSFVEDISLYDMQEIERKRQEALAKLKSKKLYNVISPSKRNIDNLQTTSEVITTKIAKAEESPIKCSPEEIEQKRLQALAKLEAKKKQDIIERNRREALKRLEMNKKKREKLLNNIRS